MNANPQGRRKMRVLPAKLSTRLMLTMVVAAIVVFAIIGTSAGLVWAYHIRSLTTTDQVNRLYEAGYTISLNARELDAFVLACAERDDLRQPTLDPQATFAASGIEPWLADRASVTTIVWHAADGTGVETFTSEGDLSALRDLVHFGTASGVAYLPSGPAIIAIRPIIGTTADTPVGTLAAARPLPALDIAAAILRPDVPGASASDIVPGDGWRELEAPEGYNTVITDFRDGQIVTRGTLESIDGDTELVLEVREPDPVLGYGRAWAVVLVPVALGLATAGVGLALGGVLSRSIGRPLGRFVSYMRDQGYLALQGLRVDRELELDPTLPDDLKELGQVLIDLMTQLRVNQSDLIEAGEQALAAERAFRTVVEESPEVKILVREGTVEIANPAAAHFFGLHLGDLLRAEPTGIFAGVTLFDEDGEPLDLTDVSAVAADPAVVARCVVPGQPDRWIELSVAPIDPDGRDYVISARNITEERRLEALRQEILSLVSHDLRSPLTVVRGYLDILERDIPEDRRQTAITGAQHAVLRMESLLEDLLNATRAERALAPTVMRPVDLAEVASGVVASLSVSSDQPLELSADESVTVLGDAVRLEQAVTNLVGNALKHGGGTGPIRIAVFTRDGRALLTVRDEGPGIEPELAERIFDRGVRGESAAGLPGMGLGLYIVKIVAEGHGGAVNVEAHDGPGAWFVMELPLETADELS